MIRRPYRGAPDVALLQAFNAGASAATGGCGFLHTGDIPHRLFNGCRLFDPAEVLTIWEDEGGVAAWVLVGPRHRGFDAQVRPDRRGSGLEREVLGYGEERTLEAMRRHGVDGALITTEVYRCDPVRAELLTEAGWAPDGDPPWVVNRIHLTGLEAPVVPEGYRLRAARGIEEAAALAAVHAAAFGSAWTPELYRRLMQSPGYAAERELVAEAPDGALAAFTVTWLDRVTRTGLFEPVGTHPDHRRRGLGRALLAFGMQRMVAAGMEHATVVNEGRNEASASLYHGVGFAPRHLLDGYAKPVPA